MQQDKNQLIQELYDAYARKIRDWAYRHTGDMERAKDIMQETFLILLVKIDEVVDHEAPYKWLFKTAGNVLKHAYRDMARESNQIPLDNMEVPAIFCETDDNLFEVFPTSFRKQDREIMIMYYVEKRSIKEICDRFGISSSACKMRLLRLRTELKKIYSEIM